MNNADLILNATLSKFKAQRDEAYATLMVLATNSVGVPEHTKIIEEFEFWTRKFAEAEECIKALQKLAGTQQQAPAKKVSDDGER